MTTTTILEKFGRRRDGFYHLPGDRKYPSVTTILSVLAKPALIHWAAKTSAALVLDDPAQYDTAEKAAGGIYAARDKAADRGSMVHSLIEALFKGSPVDPETMPDYVRGYYNGFQKWASVTQPKPIYTEATIFSDKYHYAGTMDVLCAIQNRMYLIDVKTTSGIYPEVSLQLEAYRSADFILPRGIDAVPIPMPTVSETMAVRLLPDGTYEDKPVKGDLGAFLAAKRLWEWTQVK